VLRAETFNEGKTEEVRRGWKTVRVFISSTFRDMHTERDHLARVVFPELRERMVERELHLVDVDLRWGVTEEEAEQGKVLEVCLDEIERCRPFFIGILGQRYGWVPDGIPEDTELENPWLAEYREHSITALEIIHGVVRNPAMANRSYFYFRDPSYLGDVPAPEREDFVAESAEAENKLERLKEEIRRTGLPVMEGYPCSWDAEQRRLMGLDEFGNQVLEDLWEAVCAEHPEDAPAEDPVVVEREMHEALVERLSRIHIGREEEKRRLTEYVEGQERRPIVITGEPACGKSALLATWYREYAHAHRDDFVFAHFIGASPDSTNHFRLLRRACEELKRECSLAQEIPEDDKELADALVSFLQTASQQRRVVLIIDALNQLEEREAAHGLGWLPQYLPANVRLVLSTLAGDCLEVLRRRETEEMVIPPLTEADREEIVRRVLGEYRKKLDREQMEALLAHEATANPLYLRVALEELRLFGSFEELPGRIETLAEDVPGLFDQVLERVEGDHAEFPVQSALSLLACSRHGLAEQELLDALGAETQAEVPTLLWARLRRSLAAYLIQRGNLLDFFHRHLWKAVQDRYEDHQTRHRRLAEHFATAPLPRRLDEWPYQLQHAEMWEELAEALSDLDFFSYAWDQDRKYEWIAYWRSLEGRFAPGPSYERAVADMEMTEGQTAELGSALNEVGLLLGGMGLHRESAPFMRRALEISERALGPDHPQVAYTLSGLADVHGAQSDYEQGLALSERALEIRERALGPDHPEVAKSLGSVATFHWAQANYLAAMHWAKGSYLQALRWALRNWGQGRPRFLRAIEIGERGPGPDHPDAATRLKNLAAMHLKQAEPLYLRAIEIGERTLGPEHPDVATILSNLAVLHYVQENYEQALPLHQRALQIRERALGPYHPDVANSLHGLAALHRDQGNYEQALPLHQRALEIAERALGVDHPATQDFRGNLHSCKEHIGRGE